MSIENLIVASIIPSEETMEQLKKNERLMKELKERRDKKRQQKKES